MKIYIAGSWNERDWLQDVAIEIIKATGHTITSRWWTCAVGKNALQCALMDIQDMDSADCIMVFMRGATHRGGRMVELGYAIGKGKPVILIGEPTNVFTYLMPSFPTWQEALLP